MTSEQNDPLFKSIFGETEPFEETIEMGGKTLEIKGHRTPPCTDEPVEELRLVESAYSHL